MLVVGSSGNLHCDTYILTILIPSRVALFLYLFPSAAPSRPFTIPVDSGGEERRQRWIPVSEGSAVGFPRLYSCRELWDIPRFERTSLPTPLWLRGFHESYTSAYDVDFMIDPHYSRRVHPGKESAAWYPDITRNREGKQAEAKSPRCT